jgi:hypothetical protein
MSKSTIATPYRRYVRLGHPLATGLGYVSVHRLALYEKIGQGPHSCHWCSAVVDWAPGPGARRAALVVDHLNNDPRDNAQQPRALVRDVQRQARGKRHRVEDRMPARAPAERRQRVRLERRALLPCLPTRGCATTASAKRSQKARASPATRVSAGPSARRRQRLRAPREPTLPDLPECSTGSVACASRHIGTSKIIVDVTTDIPIGDTLKSNASPTASPAAS